MHVSELDTPALVIDLDIMERNLRRVTDYCRGHDLELRPHTKTHKIPALGRKQIELGARGLTVAKTTEAEVMMKAEPPQILVAYPVLGRRKLERLVEIARRTRVIVMLDGPQAVRQLSDAAREGQVEFGVLAETDVGLNRCGVSPGEPLKELCRLVERSPRLTLEGIGFYPGHIKNLDEAGRKALAELGTLVGQTLADLRRAGINIQIVSGGSTPALYESHHIPGLTEIRPGTYIFNDKNTWSMGACAMEDCAASIIVTVVSTARQGQMIVDGGSKTFSSDRLATSNEASYGHLVEAPDAQFTKMNEEHGFISLRGVDREFSAGDRVHIIPNHICVAMNLHEHVYGIRGDQVEQIWRVEGRGKLQ